MNRFAIIAGHGTSAANEAIVSFARAAFASGREAVVIGGTGQDGILPDGSPDLTFDHANYDPVYALVALNARGYGGRCEHTPDVASADALDGIIICGDAAPSLVDEALASGAPVISFVSSLPQTLAARPDILAVAVDNTGTRSDKAAAYHMQRFMKTHS